MKRKASTFQGKLWRYFALLTVIILALIWVFQTVLLQSSYERMVTRNVESVAESMMYRATDSDFETWLNETAAENSLLIFVTDTQGQILYAADEHNSVYTVHSEAKDDTNSNPYRQGEQNWQKGQAHYLTLPASYSAFLERVKESESGKIAYPSEDGSAFIYGFRLNVSGTEAIGYISTPLTAVGSTVKIIRAQLLLVTLISLAAAFGLSWLLARRFSAPVAWLSMQAKRLADGQFDTSGTKGVSAEMDDLSDSLTQAARDITEARAYQKDFLANVSHDLRTPLTMIKGYAEMVRDISWRDDGKREADLSVIIREADRLTALVNDIVDYSGMESGRAEMKRERFSVSQMAENVIAQFDPLCSQEGYNIQSEIAPGLFTDGDEAQLSRVLYNLLDNAITHAGEDQTVLVRTMQKQDQIRVEVEDHGEGIPEDVLLHVWERYFRAAQRKRNKKGSGLGLAISREIIERHQGSYGVESTNQGSVFWFEVSSASG